MTQQTTALDQNGIDQLNHDAWTVNRTDPKRCFELATKALEASREINHQHGITHALAALGACQVWLSNYDQALTHLFEARKLLRAEGNKAKEAEVVYQIFCCFYFLADYDKALEYAHEILELADINQDQSAKANAYNGIGTIYYTIGDSKKAIESLTKGLAIASVLHDKHLLARILDGLGSAHHAEKNYTEAIEFKERSLEAARASGIKNVEAYALNGLAKIHLEKGNTTDAEKFFNQSLAIRREIEFKTGIAETLYHLGALYLQLEQMDKAGQHLHEGLEICNEVEAKEFKYKIHEALSKLYEKRNDLENFKKHFHDYFVSREEYTSEQHRQKLKSSQMQMRMSQVEKEKELLELKHRELEAYSRDLLLLSDLGKKITSLLTVEAINQNVYEILHNIMDTDGFGIGIVAPEKNAIVFPGYIEAGEVDEASYDDLADDCRLSAYCFNNDSEVLINDFDAEHHLYIKKRGAPNSGKEVSSIIYIPLRSGNKKMGVITVQSFRKNAYTSHHVNIIRNLAVYCVIAIENANLYQQLEEKVAERTTEVTQQKEALLKSYETTRLLSEIGQELTSATEFHNIFRKLYENVNQLMDAACFGVRIYIPEKNVIEYRFEIEKGKAFDEVPVVSMDNDNNYSVWCVKNKEIIFINDNVAEHKKWVKQIHVPKGDMPHSLIFYPMTIGERVIGVITVQSFQKFAYTQAHAEILKTLASYAAIALENANLIENLEVRVKARTEEVEKTARDTKLISEMGKEISSTLDVSEIVSRVYDRIGSLMDASAFGIGIYRAQKNDLFHTGVMENGKKLPDFSFDLDQDRVAVTCFKQTREIIINNWNEEYKQYVSTDSKAVEGEDPVSMIYMPLVSKGKTIGVMSVQSFNTNTYNSYHQDLVRSLSLYIGTALDNASLYHNMEERVQERTVEIEKAYQNTGLLGQISKDIFSSLSIETINEKVYHNVNTLMDATVFGIGIFDEKTGRIHMPGLIEKGEKMEEFSYDVNDERLASWCFRNQKEIFINDYSVEYKNYIKGIQAPVSGVDSSSIIYLPLFLKDKITGVITVQSFTPNAYTTYHLDILRNLAQSVASAIENARLYENMEETVRERTAEVVKTFNNTKLISEIGKEISTLLSVSEIISRVYKNVNALMDATVFGIGLYREDSKDLFFSGVMEKDHKLPDYGFDVKEEKIATICFRNTQEIIINDWHKEFSQYVAKDYDAMEGEMPESMIYLPLVSKGKTIGVITVQSFGRNTYNNYHTDLLRSLSLYIGSAIENANLYQGLEERVKERTAEIEKAYQDTKLLGQISKEISSSLSVERILESVYSNVNSLMDAACFGIGIYNAQSHTIHFPGFMEKGNRLDNVVFNADDDRLACWSFKNKKEIFTNNYPAEYKKYVTQIKTTLAGNPAKSIIYIPLFSKGEILGVMTSQSYDENKYTEYHMDILRGLSHSIATALENAMLYGSLEEKVKARTAEVVKQKEIIEEKNKHITDSIVYAKRIQQAILPPEEIFASYLQNSFVLYKPKDIVSGDFYWIERKENKILFAVVDCTGHGVPGAFMSIIGFNGLNQVVNEYNITNPAEILNQLNKIITNTLRQREEESKIRDGMDISICCIDLDKNKMEFAGANNPIFIVRNNNVIEVTADKHPIGNFIGENEFRFTNNVLDLFPNDRIYLSSDGYADQFGGPRGKKLKYTQFRDLLLANHNKPMHEQKVSLDKMFEVWRGELEQIDDVCVIGVGIQ